MPASRGKTVAPPRAQRRGNATSFSSPRAIAEEALCESQASLETAADELHRLRGYVIAVLRAVEFQERALMSRRERLRSATSTIFAVGRAA